MPEQRKRIRLGGVDVELRENDEAVASIIGRIGTPELPPLGVVSVNLDHIHHFGSGGRWANSLDDSGSMEWLSLIDGAPIAARARSVTGRSWPRLAGSDLIEPILDSAEREGHSVGFLGGDPATHRALTDTLAAQRPALVVSGFWAPSRGELSHRASSLELAAQIAAAKTDILIVGLGKPRQELWISEYGSATGSRVLLAFGAVVDFLAGRIERSPAWIARAGMEWAWRLSREPRRLARRYLVDGPPAYLTLLRGSESHVVPRATPRPLRDIRHPIEPGMFADLQTPPDVAVIVVTYNSADDLPELLLSLRREAESVTLRVIVADNDSVDGTRGLLSAEHDVILAATGGNVGYARGINSAMVYAGDARAVLILNPDLTVEPGAIESMLWRLDRSGAGIVVPSILDDAGQVYPSLRREPTISRTVGDALLGSRASGRPEWASEIEFDSESYRYAHEVEWATGAALMIDGAVAAAVGPWDGRFFLYSEETDFFRRAREAGSSIWYEPSARVRHSQGGSGGSDALDSLLAVNKVRYARKHRSAAYAAGMHAGAILNELMRSYGPAHRRTLRILLDQRTWRSLPKAVEGTLPEATGDVIGSVIIPAHNEATVIARVLSPLATLASAGRLDVWVVCNGCTDNTAEIARGFAGVNVLEIATASKVAALNAGDATALAWPRLYLDADIEISPAAVAAVAHRLEDPTVLAARPAYRWDTTGASFLVRCYYRARDRMLRGSTALWGAGAYAVSEDGHARFGSFPSVTADDVFVDLSFAPSEKRIVDTTPVVVLTPRTREALLGVLRRQVRGSVEQSTGTAGTSARDLLSTVRTPGNLLDAVVYAGFAAASRAPRRGGGRWESDRTTRTDG